MNPQNDLKEIENLTKQVNAAQLPQELKDKALQQIERITMTLKFGDLSRN